ncbi:MAG: PqiC family protein [Verrucomicrobiota bacterium]
MIRTTLLHGAATALIVLLTSCGGGYQSFYTITPDGMTPTRAGVGIGVGPVNLAEYIDRPNLVVAEGPNQLGVADDHRWAGDLSGNIARVVSTNLGRKFGTGNVHSYPWSRDDGIRWQITLDIRQLHGGADGHALIEAGWRVFALPGRRIISSGTFVDREPLENDGYPALVAAESRLISRLSETIAARLKY